MIITPGPDRTDWHFARARARARPSSELRLPVHAGVWNLMRTWVSVQVQVVVLRVMDWRRKASQAAWNPCTQFAFNVCNRLALASCLVLSFTWHHRSITAKPIGKLTPPPKKRGVQDQFLTSTDLASGPESSLNTKVRDQAA
eukprot:785002-Rhodomonas_salina.1